MKIEKLKHEAMPLQNRQFEASQDVLASQVGKDAVLMHVSTSEYHSLNEVSWLVWNAIEEKRSISDVVSEIAELYDVEQEKLLADIEFCLQYMLDKQLIHGVSQC